MQTCIASFTKDGRVILMCLILHECFALNELLLLLTCG